MSKDDGINEELERWRKLMSPEEFSAKFPHYARERAIKETIDKIRESTNDKENESR